MSDSPVRHEAVPTLLVNIGILATLILLRSTFLRMDLTRISLTAVIVGAATLVSILVSTRRGAWGAGFLYLLLLVLFHVGLLFTTLLGIGQPADLTAYNQSWFFGPYLIEACYVSTLAAAAFTTAYLASILTPGTIAPETDQTPSTGYAKLGLGLLTFGAVLFIGDVLRSAPGLFTSGGTSTGAYDAFQQTLGGSKVIAVAQTLVAFGVILAASGAPSRMRRASLWVFVLYAIPVLLIGARTAVMFPAVAGIVALARTTKMPRQLVAFGLVIVALAGLGAIRDLRTQSLTVTSIVHADYDPLDAFTELGGSLRPVAETVQQVRGNGQPTLGGDTYVEPFRRAADRVDGLPETPASADQRIPSSLIVEWVPNFQVGFSSVAEAFLNWGTSGVLAVFALFGLLLGRYDRNPRRTAATAARLGVIVYAMAYEVRNGATALPYTILTGFLLIWLAGAWSSLAAVVRRRSETFRLNARAQSYR